MSGHGSSDNTTNCSSAEISRQAALTRRRDPIDPIANRLFWRPLLARLSCDLAFPSMSVGRNRSAAHPGTEPGEYLSETAATASPMATPINGQLSNIHIRLPGATFAPFCHSEAVSAPQMSC
jgi:hypothetical protein